MKTLSVISFEEWLAMQPDPEDKISECPCCNGSGEVDLEDDYGNDYYNITCKHCDGEGVVDDADPPLSRRDWIAAVRADARRYRKFTGINPKLKLTLSSE